MSSSTARAVPKLSKPPFGRVVWVAPVLLTGLCALCLLLPVWPFKQIDGGFIDLQVYRLGIDALRHGADMYGELPKTTFGISLPFIYPPFAALALMPFALLPWGAAAFSFFVASTAALGATLYVVARRIWPEQQRRRLAVFATACALPLAVLLEPSRSTLGFGQVNLLLMALIAVDCLALRPKWRRGMLIGLAAAVKLTPAAFVLYFLVRRDYKAAATAAVTGALATTLSFLLLPRESVNYWFGGLGNVSGLSGSSFHTNQSIQAVLARFQVPEPLFTLLWLALSAALLALVVVAMRRTAAFPALALACNAVFTLLVSPISWSHHWVWIAPALLAMAGYAIRLPRRAALGCALIIVVTAAVFVYGPQNWLPGGDRREMTWSVWQHIVGNTYIWLSVALVALCAAVGPRSPAATGTAEDAEPQTPRVTSEGSRLAA